MMFTITGNLEDLFSSLTKYVNTYNDSPLVFRPRIDYEGETTDQIEVHAMTTKSGSVYVSGVYLDSLTNTKQDKFVHLKLTDEQASHLRVSTYMALHNNYSIIR